jgi:hypothetical protein
MDPHQGNPCSKNIADATRAQATVTEGSAVEYVVLAEGVVNDDDAELDKLGA